MKHLHSLILHLFSFIFVVCLLLKPSGVLAQESTPLSPNPAAEQWVLQQVELGEIADLEDQFPSEADRVLSAAFLERLLENPPVSITRYGVRIQNAIFVDPVDFEFVQVGYNLRLENCRFESYVDFSDGHIAGDLSFDDSTFKSRADFYKIQVDKTLYLNNSTFESSVQFTYAVVGGNLVANDSRFNSTDKEAEFNSMKVGGTVFLRRVIFAGPVDFVFANIGSLVADDAQFTSAESEADFNTMKAGGNVFLRRAVFAGPVDFTHVQIGYNLEADDAQFTNAEKEAEFNSMVVGKYTFLREAVFAGPVNFRYVRIGINLEANDAQFTNLEGEADFNSMKVDGSIFLNNAIFAGPVDFGRVQVGTVIDLDDAQFSNAEKEASFNSMKVDGSVFLTNAIFAGSVDFVRAQIGSVFDLDGVRFNNAEEEASFNSMKVDGSIHLNEAIFAGFADFGYVIVGGVFDLDDARFGNEEQEANFNSMKVGDSTFFRRIVFLGPIDFRYAEFGYFDASEAEFQNVDNESDFSNTVFRGQAWFDGTVFKGGADFSDASFLDLLIYGKEGDNSLSKVSLNRAVVHREFRLWNLEIDEMSAESLTVHGIAFIKNANIAKSINLENASFTVLDLENVNWPGDKESVILRGTKYQNFKIVRDENKDVWEDLITLVDNSAYSAQTYTVLENYFLAQGYPERADRVYTAYKRRERAEALSPTSLDWWWSLFLDVFVSYGRSPGRAIIWGLLLILLGGFVFRKEEGMVSLSKREIVGSKVGKRGTLSRKIPMRVEFSPHGISYNPFWYSLDLFIPFVDLGYDTNWFPKPGRKWAVMYSKLHMLAGWILIPIGLLAITGVIK